MSLTYTCSPSSNQGPHLLAQGLTVLRVLVQELHDVQETLDIPVHKGLGRGDITSALAQAPFPPDSAALTLVLPLLWAPHRAVLADKLHHKFSLHVICM